jgi:mRNA interferase RelE/StbE
VSDYTIKFARSAGKELEMLDAVVISRILPRREALAEEPRPRGCRKLHGEGNLWRIRIGDYRVLYVVYDKERIVDFVTVRPCSKAYE